MFVDDLGEARRADVGGLVAALDETVRERNQLRAVGQRRCSGLALSAAAPDDGTSAIVEQPVANAFVDDDWRGWPAEI